MPLETSCESFKGALIYFLPIEGYGWSKMEPNKARFQPGLHATPPSPFHARIVEFHYFEGAIQAGVGVIEQESHAFEKKWVAFCIRDGMRASVFNFTDNPCQYNIMIGENKPTIKIDPQALAMPEWMQFSDKPYISGLGYIVESAVSLQEIYEKIKKARRQ